jgi:iron complex outermembrane receptor protein
VALFHADYTDIQRLLSPDPIGAPSVTVTWNAGEATIDGAELEFVFRPTEWLEFAGFWAYTRTDFVEFIGPPPASVNLAGNPFSRAPENIVSASVTVDLPMPVSMGDANLGVRYFHQDRYNASDSFNPLIHWFEAQDLVNLTVEWNGVFGSNVDLLGFVNNAFDNEYVNPYFPNSPASVNSVVAGEPRTYGVRLRYSFGE